MPASSLPEDRWSGRGPGLGLGAVAHAPPRGTRAASDLRGPNGRLRLAGNDWRVLIRGPSIMSKSVPETRDVRAQLTMPVIEEGVGRCCIGATMFYLDQ